MPALRTILFTSLVVAAAALPATALAKPQAQPLVDVTPLGSHFKDRVISSSSRTARAAIGGKWAPYPTKEGTTVSAAISDRYANRLSTQVAQSYVDFLDSLDHGAELSTLRIYIATPDEVLTDCGGQDGTLACYDSGTKIMVVPGEETDTGSSGVTTSYVVAHEYGHHIAASRSNAPFSAFRFGPKYWASYERVCDRSLKGVLAPGNEQQLYLANPGEAWAETYAQLKYPSVDWQFTPLLKPDGDAFAAARRDVLDPWRAGATKVFKGTFGGGGSKTKRFQFNLALDGRLQVRLNGPRASNYNFSLSSDGRSEGRTTAAGSRDSVSYDAACRESPVEHVSVAVKRVRGSGPFTVRVAYAG
jgi:hypothetical protein